MFERTNENEDEEKACEKERARRRLVLEEESSSYVSSEQAKVAFAFLSKSKSSSSLGRKTEEEEEKGIETIAFFSNSRVPLTVCEEILSSFKRENKKFEKIGHVKVSGVSERNDCLSDDFDEMMILTTRTHSDTRRSRERATCITREKRRSLS